MEYTIYSIRCIVTNKLYFGRSQEVEKRWRSHRNMLRKGKHNNLLLQDDWQKYGEESFEFNILEVTYSLDEAVIKEQDYIDNSKFEKYNISDARNGGNTFKNNPRSSETRKLKSINTIGENNPMYGRPKSEYAIMRTKEANSKKVVIDGIVYDSSVEASKNLNVKTTTVNYRLKSQSERFKDWNYVQ